MFSGTVEIYLIFGEMRLILLQEWEAGGKIDISEKTKGLPGRLCKSLSERRN